MSENLGIQFLGTGAAVPSARRGLPAMAIKHDGGIILCDAGEGVQMAIRQAGLSPSKIHTIIFSHSHGDHLFGLPGFISSQELMSRSNPLTLVGPPEIKTYIDCLRDIIQFNISFPLYFHELGPDAPPFQIGPFTVTTLPLVHRTECYGYRFTEPPKTGRLDAEKAETLGIPGPLRKQLKLGNPVTVNGKTIQPEELVGPEQPGRIIAWCTDTRPCENAVKLAKKADVLIYESTFPHAKEDHAYISHHSTSVQAAQVAKKARAKSLYLTHFSIRNIESTEMEMLLEARDIFPATQLAQDYLQFNIPRREM